MAAIKTATLEINLGVVNDAGEAKDKRFDPLPLVLSNLVGLSPGIRFSLGASETARSIATGQSSTAIVIYSHDNPFKLRVLVGELQMLSTRLFVLWGGANNVETHPGSLLIDGNGVTPSDIEWWSIDKVTP